MNRTDSELEAAHRLLGVRAGVPPEQIDRAFRARVLTHHPDRGGDPQIFRRLVEARAVLLHAGGTVDARAALNERLVFYRTEAWWRRLLLALVDRLPGGPSPPPRVR